MIEIEVQNETTQAQETLRFAVVPRIGPSCGPEDVLREAAWPEAERVIVVGHQPTLGEVAARLIGSGDGEVSFRKGAVWWFATRSRDGNDEVVLKVVMNPEMLEG